MRINEVDDSRKDLKELTGLVQFLAGRADNTNAQKSIDKATLIATAQSLGIPVTDETLPGLIAQPPLNGVLEPLNPQDPKRVFFKGADIGSTGMTVPQAQQVVNKMAKSAMKRGMK